MALALKIDVVTKNFDGMLNDIAAIDPAIEFRTIVVQMALRVLQGASNRTGAATIASITKNETHLYLTKEWVTIEGKKYLVQGKGNDGHANLYPDWLWSGIQSMEKQNMAKRIADRSEARGLAKQSWWWLAVKLGGTIDLPSYAQSANYHGRTYRDDVSTQEDAALGQYGLTIINSSEIALQAGGYAALLGAMQAEVGYFNQNMAHGFNTSLARRAAKYPGIFVNRN